MMYMVLLENTNGTTNPPLVCWLTVAPLLDLQMHQRLHPQTFSFLFEPRLHCWCWFFCSLVSCHFTRSIFSEILSQICHFHQTHWHKEPSFSFLHWDRCHPNSLDWSQEPTCRYFHYKPLLYYAKLFLVHEITIEGVLEYVYRFFIIDCSFCYLRFVYWKFCQQQSTLTCFKILSTALKKPFSFHLEWRSL